MKKKWTLWKRRWLPYLIAYSAKYVIRLLLRTCRIRIHGLETFVSTANSTPCILMLWHDKLVIISEIINTYTSDFICTAFISKSRDGDPLALITQSYARGRVLRVPHNARHKALSKMIDLLKDKKSVIVITPDGPRGPSHIIKPGIVMAAQESSATIIPFSWNASRFWQLNTWDKMQIPKPFTTLHVTFGSPIAFKKEVNTLEQDMAILSDAIGKFQKT